MPAVKLPLADPPIYGYHYLAYPLSVMAQHAEYLPWFHSNFIQLCCTSDMLGEGTMHFDFYNYDFTVHPLPWLDIQRLSRDLLSAAYGDAKQFLRDALDRGMYIYLFLNDYYLPSKPAYRTEHFYHDNFIFGYDDEAEVFHTVGFDKNGHYRENDVTYNQLREAFDKVEYIKEELRYLHLFQFRADGEYAFDSGLVKRLLGDYLNAANTSEQFGIFSNPKKQVYGIGVYASLVQYLEHLYQQIIAYDIRPFHLLLEHKKCMLSRIRYMEAHCGLKSAEPIYHAYSEIERLTSILKAMMLRYAVTSNPGILLDNIERVNVLMRRDREATAEFLYLIEMLDKSTPR